MKAEFRTSFGRKGRTLVYEDSAGMLLFAFDCSPTQKNTGRQWNLHLSKKALIDVDGTLLLFDGATESERERVEIAVERIAQYASLCGYHVLKEE